MHAAVLVLLAVSINILRDSSLHLRPLSLCLFPLYRPPARADMIVKQYPPPPPLPSIYFSLLPGMCVRYRIYPRVWRVRATCGKRL